MPTMLYEVWEGDNCYEVWECDNCGEEFNSESEAVSCEESHDDEEEDKED